MWDKFLIRDVGAWTVLLPQNHNLAYYDQRGRDISDSEGLKADRIRPHYSRQPRIGYNHRRLSAGL